MDSNQLKLISELRETRRIAHASLLRDRTAIGVNEVEIMELTDQYGDFYREGLRAHLYEIENNARGPKAQAIYHRELDMMVVSKKAKEEHLEAGLRDLMKSEDAFHEAVLFLKRADAKMIKEMEEVLGKKRVQAEEEAKAKAKAADASTGTSTPKLGSVFGPGRGSESGN